MQHLGQVESKLPEEPLNFHDLLIKLLRMLEVQNQASLVVAPDFIPVGAKACRSTGWEEKSVRVIEVYLSLLLGKDLICHFFKSF